MTKLRLVEVTCALCGSDDFEVVCDTASMKGQLEFLHRFHRRRLKPASTAYAAADRADFTQDYVTNIVACRVCGLICRNPRPDDAMIDRLYAHDTYGEKRLEALHETQRRFFRGKARMLAKWLGPRAEIVEVGSFVGAFLASARERGWRAIGVDPGEEVTAFTRRKGLCVVRGVLADLDIAPHSVDCVAVWNTLDQVPDPRSLIGQAVELLRPGGYLVIRVPNGEAFRRVSDAMRERHPAWRRPYWKLILLAAAWNNLLAFPYLEGYTLPALDRMMSACGLDRVAAHRDNLCPLADSDTRWWARVEEWLTKLVSRAAFRVEELVAPSRYRTAPWLDVVYRARMGAAGPLSGVGRSAKKKSLRDCGIIPQAEGLEPTVVGTRQA